METVTRTLTSVNPATLEPIAGVPIATSDDVRAAVVRAREAQRGWGSRSLADRASFMRSAAQITASRAEELARALTAESGKTIFESYAAEVLPVAETFKWLSKTGPRHLAPERLKHSSLIFRLKKSWLRYEPVGVVGIISPWNYPLSIPATEVAFALMAGNGVVLKPSEHTPLIAERIREIVIGAGIPADLFQIVHGHGDVGAALIDAQPDRMLFTGSVATGRRVAAACGERGIAVTLELGGKDAMIVRADADVDRAVAGALFGSYFNAGQTCAAVERVYVHKAVAPQFTEKLAARAAALKVGDPMQPGTDVGPMIHDGQRQILAGHVEDARARGATLLAGGAVDTGLPGAFYAPAVLTGVPDDAPLMREETFGPAVPIRVVESDDEAVHLANDTEFGLTASVWTRDEQAGLRMAGELDAGTVFVNDLLYSYASPDAPWGGVKSSGTGRTHSRYGLHELTSVKHVSLERSWVPSFLNYPFSPELTDTMRHLTTALYGPGRARAFVKTLRSMRRAMRG